MRISVIAVGRLRPPYQDDIDHYRKLIGGHVRLELIDAMEDNFSKWSTREGIRELPEFDDDPPPA